MTQSAIASLRSQLSVKDARLNKDELRHMLGAALTCAEEHEAELRKVKAQLARVRAERDKSFKEVSEIAADRDRHLRGRVLGPHN